MPDRFHVKTYQQETEQIKLTAEQKNILTAKMYQVQDDMKNLNNKPDKKRLWLKPAAAALAAIIVIGGVLAINNLPKSSENRFILTADAASDTYDEALKYPENTNIIGAFTTGGDSGSAMELNHQSEIPKLYEKDGYIDYFWRNPLEELKVIGKEIKNVKFKSLNKGVYFSIEAETVNKEDKNGKEFITIGGISYKNISDSKTAKEKFLSMFSDYDKLNNSQYSREEFRKYYVNGGDIICDEFTYNNPKINSKAVNILPQNIISLTLETNHSNPETASLLKENNYIRTERMKLDEELKTACLAKKPKTYKEYDELYSNALKSSEKYSDLIKEEDRTAKQLKALTLNNVKLEVTTTFTDNSTETQIVTVTNENNGIRLVR